MRKRCQLFLYHINPIYLFAQELERGYGHYLSPWCGTGITPKEYISFILFEMLAENYENELVCTSLRQHQMSLLEKQKRIYSSADILDREKKRSKDLQLRRNFRDAKMKRFHIEDIPQYESLSRGMKDRAAPKDGYNLTKIQSFQLEDKEDLTITKTFNITRFGDSSNTSGKDIKEYYAALAEKSTERSEISSLDDRILYAINLNKFENENLYGICYRIARYCFDHKIKIIPENVGNVLLALTGAICCGPIQIHKKPVLLVEKILPSVINQSASNTEAAIGRYTMLQYQGISLRKSEEIIEDLSHIGFTLEDFWEFICYDYNVFGLYQNIYWDGKGQTISTLRKIVKIVAIDPLS